MRVGYLSRDWQGGGEWSKSTYRKPELQCTCKYGKDGATVKTLCPMCERGNTALAHSLPLGARATYGAYRTVSHELLFDFIGCKRLPNLWQRVFAPDTSVHEDKNNAQRVPHDTIGRTSRGMTSNPVTVVARKASHVTRKSAAVRKSRDKSGESLKVSRNAAGDNKPRLGAVISAIADKNTVYGKAAKRLDTLVSCKAEGELLAVIMRDTFHV